MLLLDRSLGRIGLGRHGSPTCNLMPTVAPLSRITPESIEAKHRASWNGEEAVQHRFSDKNLSGQKSETTTENISDTTSYADKRAILHEETKKSIKCSVA